MNTVHFVFYISFFVMLLSLCFPAVLIFGFILMTALVITLPTAFIYANTLCIVVFRTGQFHLISVRNSVAETYWGSPNRLQGKAMRWNVFVSFHSNYWTWRGSNSIYDYNKVEVYSININGETWLHFDAASMLPCLWLLALMTGWCFSDHLFPNTASYCFTS